LRASRWTIRSNCRRGQRWAASEDSNLESAARAARELGEAQTHLQRWLSMQVDHPAAETDDWFGVAAALEVARTAQRAADLVAYYLGAEAVDRGARPRVLGWPDPSSATDC
jgi:hypothetical protein